MANDAEHQRLQALAAEQAAAQEQPDLQPPGQLQQLNIPGTAMEVVTNMNTQGGAAAATASGLAGGIAPAATHAAAAAPSVSTHSVALSQDLANNIAASLAYLVEADKARKAAEAAAAAANLAGAATLSTVPALGAVPVLGAGQGGGRSTSEEERQKKLALLMVRAEFDADGDAWRKGKLLWSLRGKRGISEFTTEFMGIVLVNLVSCSSAVLQQLKSMASINIFDYFPVGQKGEEISVADHFDLACSAIMTTLKYGLKANNADDAAVLVRLNPIEAAMLQGRATFRTNILQNRKQLAHQAARPILADMLNSDLADWAAALREWAGPLLQLSRAPPSFDAFGLPPVPAFTRAGGLNSAGSHIVKLSGSRQGGQAQVSGRKRGSASAAGGEHKRQGSQRQVCHQFLARGACTYGDRCRFRHDQGTSASGEKGGGGGSNTDGNAGGGAGGRKGGGGGPSSALVVRGGVVADP